MSRFLKASLVVAVAVSVAASAVPAYADAICPDPTPKIFGISPGVAIPDNNPNGVSVTINVPDDDPACPLIWDLNVGIRVRHTWQGDLSMRLSHVESGESVLLLNRPGVGPGSTFGFSNDNYGDQATGALFIFDDEAATPYGPPHVASPGINNVSGPWQPVESLSAFDYNPKAGTWVFQVIDHAGGDLGTIDRVELHFVNKIPEPATLGLLGMGALLMIRRRVR